MRDETFQVVQHQHHDDELDVENRLPVNDDDDGNFVKSDTAEVTVESGQANLNRIVAANDEKMSTPKMKKLAPIMGLMIVCVLVIVVVLVVDLRDDHANAHAAKGEAPMATAVPQVAGGDVQTQTTADIDSTSTTLIRSQTSETNIPLSVTTSETGTPLFQLGSSSPSPHPTLSSVPSSSPSELSTASPTSSPVTDAPTSAPFLPLTYGQELSWNYNDLGIEVSTGISVKVIAQTGSCVMYGDGNVSTHRYHSQMDGAGIITLPNGGYVYVSNSELEDGDGGRSCCC